MKDIYVAHSRNIDYINEIYKPIRKSKLNSVFNIVLPHENSLEPYNSKEFLKTCSYMIAEVSYPGIGIGIELGWANVYEIPIICIYKKNSNISNSIKVITNTFIEYSDEVDLINKLEQYFIKLT